MIAATLQQTLYIGLQQDQKVKGYVTNKKERFLLESALFYLLHIYSITKKQFSYCEK